MLQYIAEAAPNCDMILIHDDNLALLDGLGYNTSREALQPDVELSYLRSSKPLIHEVLFSPDDLSPDNNGLPVANTELIRVATLSAIYERQPELGRMSDSIMGRMTSPDPAYVVSSRASERHQTQVHHPPSLPSPTPVQIRSPYDVSRGHRAYQPYALATQPSSPHIRKRKALLIGINDSTHPNPELNQDIYETAYFLRDYLGFERNSTRVLTDDQPLNLPIKKNILAAMYWLVEGAQSGDSLFFFFSGPTAQIKDTNGDGPDGLDEVMCTMEFLSSPANPWVITDNDVHDIMIKPLPPKCRLTAIIDTCHSGTLLDLPFIYNSHGMLTPNNPSVVERRSSDADVISLSACKDNQEDHVDGRASEAWHGGAMRRVSQTFKEYTTSSGYRVTYLDIIRSLCAGTHANGLRQQPQLSSSSPIDINQDINQRFLI
ncbi:caspase domain-containing protein [Lactarius psammicola]|nr:caspase domain-containing protein [Lactarius psammicola]